MTSAPRGRWKLRAYRSRGSERPRCRSSLSRSRSVHRLETEARNTRQGRLADHLTRMDFVILDELGSLPFAQSGGQLLFHLTS
jgi:hypothetical protein